MVMTSNQKILKLDTFIMVINGKLIYKKKFELIFNLYKLNINNAS